MFIDLAAVRRIFSDMAADQRWSQEEEEDDLKQLEQNRCFPYYDLLSHGGVVTVNREIQEPRLSDMYKNR